ncbi:CopG family transcriptional regulator [Pseudomonas sp. 31-12]|uniref:type II toxin-antitoxin system RelB family antitoxin n=1 Tax=Pseudomonas sp. 31-12 TaxID=2201356 RepID=UPI000D6D45C6|nr:CopG family transcriptional regulator [Pseudomonas sp. 31-12]AWM92491.1 CopG family transcriptional regulator [Pseudomonas sp. 31-12]
MASVRLSPETHRRLDFLAASTGRPKAYFLREIVVRGLPELEEYYLSVEILKRVRNGMEPVHSAADIRKDLGLED